MKELDTLYDICEILSQELEEYNEKLNRNGGEMGSGDLEVIDKLTHALKSVKTTIAMLEAEDRGYSGKYWDGRYYYDGAPDMGGSNGRGSSRGSSYARGRGSNARRDSRGRYSSEYSRAEAKEDIIAELHELKNSAKDEETRKKLEHFINEMK